MQLVARWNCGSHSRGGGGQPDAAVVLQQLVPPPAPSALPCCIVCFAMLCPLPWFVALLPCRSALPCYPALLAALMQRLPCCNVCPALSCCTICSALLSLFFFTAASLAHGHLASHSLRCISRPALHVSIFSPDVTAAIAHDVTGFDTQWCNTVDLCSSAGSVRCTNVPSIHCRAEHELTL